MKKFFLSTFVFLASAGYVMYQYLGGGSVSAASSPVATVAPTAQTATPSTTTFTTQSQPSVTTNTPAPTPAPTVTVAPTPAPAAVPAQTGQYKNGTYTGSPASAYYGTVQVQAVIQGGKLAAVNFLQYPSDRRTSQYINGSAMPVLQSEAIQAQSSNVSAVSGATDTSGAFQQSLSSALAQAANS